MFLLFSAAKRNAHKLLLHLTVVGTPAGNYPVNIPLSPNGGLLYVVSTVHYYTLGRAVAWVDPGHGAGGEPTPRSNFVPLF